MNKRRDGADTHPRYEENFWENLPASFARKEREVILPFVFTKNDYSVGIAALLVRKAATGFLSETQLHCVTVSQSESQGAGEASANFTLTVWCEVARSDVDKAQEYYERWVK